MNLLIYPLDVTTMCAHSCQICHAISETRNGSSTDNWCPSVSNTSTANLRKVKKTRSQAKYSDDITNIRFLEICKKWDRMTNRQEDPFISRSSPQKYNENFGHGFWATYFIIPPGLVLE